MVEQVDRLFLADLGDLSQEEAMKIYGGQFDNDPYVKRRLAAVEAFRIAAEARGKEAAAEIADNWNDSEHSGGYVAKTIASQIRASIGQEQTSEVERLREAIKPFVDLKHQKGAWAIVQKATGDFEPVTLTVTKRQMLDLMAALNGGQHG